MARASTEMRPGGTGGASEPEAPSYPCPACDSTLFGWTAARDPLDRNRRIVLDRCETCGLAVTRAAEPPDADAELHPLTRTRGEDGTVEVTAPNRRSFQGGLGGAQWAGLEPGRHRLHLTPDSLRRLLAERGLEVESVRTPFTSASRRSMVQTLINAFTLRDNFLRNARSGLIRPANGRERWLHRLDYAVSYVTLIPAALLGIPLEWLGTRLHRGGIMEARARRSA